MIEFKPRFFVLPAIALTAYASEEDTRRALTAGFDAVDRHEYAAAAWWSLEGKTPGWDLIYLNHSFYPDLTMELSGDVGAPDRSAALTSGDTSTRDDTRTIVSLARHQPASTQRLGTPQ